MQAPHASVNKIPGRALAYFRAKLGNSFAFRREMRTGANDMRLLGKLVSLRKSRLVGPRTGGPSCLPINAAPSFLCTCGGRG